MWENAETVAILDREGIVRAISRNEEEAAIKNVIGVRNLEERTVESCRAAAREAFENALNGNESELEMGHEAFPITRYTGLNTPTKIAE